MSSILISICAVALLSYWFRYTCASILLKSQLDDGKKGGTGQGSRLNFPNVRATLRNPRRDMALGPLHELLRRDYQLLLFLVRHTQRSGMESLETRILIVDYQLMQVWYLMTLHLVRSQARRALEEMAGIVGYLAQRTGSHSNSFLQV